MRKRTVPDYIKTILDVTPLCCSLWTEDLQLVDCNKDLLEAFEVSSQEEFLNNFHKLSPEYQPCGRPSSEMVLEYVQTALKEGRCQFEWIHQKLSGEFIFFDITLIRIRHDGQYFLISYMHDLRELKASLAEMRRTDERTRIMLDATPLCCNLWDTDLNNIECNQEAVNLFDLTCKQEYLDRFFDLSPEYQPNGRPSAEMAQEYINQAFATGRVRFEWMHQKLNKEPMPSEITLVLVKYEGKDIVAGYTRDLRELKAMFAEMRAADERTRLMFEATPLGCNYWDENGNIVDCNQEVVNLFGISSKQEYLDHFFNFSPEYQPDGTPSRKKAMEKVREAFDTGRVCFEWMHQKLNGDPIPSEVTLVRVTREEKYIVAGYTRDLRELKSTVTLLNKLEKLAFTDNLTGVYNRHYFMEHARELFTGNEENTGSMFVILFDLDHFKNINDTYGHIAGDFILKSVAQVVQGILRPYDIFARYGGEEFIIFISNSSMSSAMKLAERVREEVSHTKCTYMGKSISVTISLGVANQSEATASFEEVINLADKALYMAKNNGRNRAEYCN